MLQIVFTMHSWVVVEVAKGQKTRTIAEGAQI